MPEKDKKFRLIAVFTLFALPVLLVLSLALIVSVNSPFIHSLGQVTLTVIISAGLLVLGGFLSYGYVNREYIAPSKVIDKLIKDIKSRTFKPMADISSIDNFKDIYNELSGLDSSFLESAHSIDNCKLTVQSQNELFETSVFEVADPVIVLDNNFQVKYVNLASQTFTGIKKSDATGKKINQFVRFYDKNNTEIAPTVYLSVPKQNPSNKTFFSPEAKIISGINVQAYADISVFKIVSGNLINVSFVILFHDKTKEKQLEAMKLDFVSMAAHELRTPLTSIKGYISVFINENQNKLTEDQMMFVRRINTSTQQLAGLVENLLSVARVERGALSLNTQVIDWVANVNSQFETFLHRADEKRITLTFDKPERAIPKVSVDLVRINEVLNNLISNALNYTEPMGKINVSITTDADMVITSVKDTGKGIPAEALPHLFSKFFRVQGGPAEQASKGNGLGLYLSKAIVELHKGKIWAESEGAGKGSTFSFSLPAVKETIDLSILTKSM